jgi:UrcA family protein
MNARTLLRWPSSRAVVAMACMALSGVAPLAALADPPAAQPPHTLQSRVSLADLDLSTPEGYRLAQKRLRRKAEYLCRQLWDDASASFRWTYAACVKETLAEVSQRLDMPAVVAVDRARIPKER